MKILTIATVITLSSLSLSAFAENGNYDIRDWRETSVQAQEIQTPAAKPTIHVAKSMDFERMIEDNPTAAGRSHRSGFLDIAAPGSFH